MGIFDESFLVATLTFTVPLLLAGMGELVSQRTGVINIGLEGMMLVGAFFAFLVTWHTGSLTLGAGAGLGAGALTAVVVAALAINARADQIIVGIGINVAALGLTTFLNQQLFSGQRASVDAMQPLAIPLLSDIPVIGKPLFDQVALAYVALLLVPAVWFLLAKTRSGLLIRATGEAPAVVDTAGTSVAVVRWWGALTAGALAGLGGAMLALGSVGVFIPGMSAGQGFIALASVIVGHWRPVGVFGACLLFGSATALQLRLQTAAGIPREVWLVALVATCAFVAWFVARRRGRLRVTPASATAALLALGIALYITRPSLDLPVQMWLMLPYVSALVVLAGVGGRVRMPAALAVPYERGGVT
jgi:general nucleoside transport system permease protein